MMERLVRGLVRGRGLVLWTLDTGGRPCLDTGMGPVRGGTTCLAVLGTVAFI